MEDDISQRFESCDARLLEHDKQLHELSQKVGVLENASKDSTVALFVYVVVADKASAKEILKTAADVSALASHLL